MKLTADQNGSIRHFSAKLGWKEQFESKEIEMLTAGAVPMLIPPKSVQGRKNNVIQYDISPYSTLEFYLSCILSREQFAELLLQCINMFRRMQQVYLSYKNLVFDLDKSYVLLADRSIHFIYLPLANSKREASIPDFLRLLVKKASRSTYEQASFLDACTAWLDRSSDFVMDEFEKFITNETSIHSGQGQEIQRQYGKQIAAQSYSALRQDPPQPTSAQAEEKKFYHPPAKLTGGGVIPSAPVQGNTVPLDAAPTGDTVLLGAEETPPIKRFFLIREQTGERIEITRSPFFVGTEPGSVSYCISDNSHISRRHAEFSIEDGECRVLDNGSTNKSYLNDCMLDPFKPRTLKEGDRIALANEKFTFHQEG